MTNPGVQGPGLQVSRVQVARTPGECLHSFIHSIRHCMTNLCVFSFLGGQVGYISDAYIFLVLNGKKKKNGWKEGKPLTLNLLIIIIIIKGHSLRRACLQPATPNLLNFDNTAPTETATAVLCTTHAGTFDDSVETTNKHTSTHGYNNYCCCYSLGCPKQLLLLLSTA